MQDVYLFVKKDYYYNLGFNKEGQELYNLPQYNTDITLYKGIDNKIRFSLRDRDRKGISLRDREIFITLLNPKLDLKLVKKLYCKDSYKGLYDVTFTEKELRDFEPTYYQASVTCKDLEGDEDILYSGVEWKPFFNINIKDGLKDYYKPAIVVDCENMLHEFYNDREMGQCKHDYYVSERIKADENESQTASVKIDCYCGKVIMEGSMEINPSDNDWFTIDCKKFISPTSETFGFNKSVNCLWVRFKHIPLSINNGKVKEILYRN